MIIGKLALLASLCGGTRISFDHRWFESIALSILIIVSLAFLCVLLVVG